MSSNMKMINEFLDRWVGEWFAQRTDYNLPDASMISHKANLALESLSIDHPLMREWCQQENVASHNLLRGFQLSWDNAPDWGKPKQVGFSLLIFLVSEDEGNTGKFYQKQGNTCYQGEYLLQDQDTLILTLKQGNSTTEERQWFISENVRLRTSLTHNNTGLIHTAFYSEIRRIPPKTNPTEDTASVTVA